MSTMIRFRITEDVSTSSKVAQKLYLFLRVRTMRGCNGPLLGAFVAGCMSMIQVAVRVISVLRHIVLTPFDARHDAPTSLPVALEEDDGLRCAGTAHSVRVPEEIVQANA